MMPSDAPHLFLAPLLIPLGLLGLFCFLIHLGIRKDRDGLVIGSGIALIVIGAPIAYFSPFLLAFFLEQKFLFTNWYIVMGIVWSFLAFSGLKYSDEPKGKAMLVFAILWTFLIPIPLIIVWEWSTAGAYLTVFGLTALGYMILGILLKSVKAAQERKEALHKRLQEEFDTREKPPWER